MKLNRAMYSITLLAGVALMGAHPAFADVTVVYKMTSRDGSGTQTIRYADKQHVRLNMSGAGNRKMSMMKLGDKVYMINGNTVQDLDQLAQMMAMMGKGAKGNKAKRTDITYEDTGRTETIAGIQGKVYRFVERGKKHEIVLADDKDLHAAALGVVEIAKAMSAMMPADSKNMMRQNAPIKSMAMLRLDNNMHLQSIDRKKIQNSLFKLPGKPQQLGGMGALLKGMADKK